MRLPASPAGFRQRAPSFLMETKTSMRSTARWVGGEKRRFAPDAISGHVEKTPAPGDLPRLLAAKPNTLDLFV